MEYPKIADWWKKLYANVSPLKDPPNNLFLLWLSSLSGLPVFVQLLM